MFEVVLRGNEYPPLAWSYAKSKEKEKIHAEVVKRTKRSSKRAVALWTWQTLHCRLFSVSSAGTLIYHAHVC